jgi:adenosylhomocysteine nucleosidase
MSERPTKRVAVLAPMRPELKAVVRAGSLTRTENDAVFSHSGSAGEWTVLAGVIGMGPAVARLATERILASGPFDHVMVVGIAGGLDPALPVGSLMVPSQVRLHPDGPLYFTHPLPPRTAEGGLMTTDGLFSDEAVWRPILESGFGAVDMEASGVAEACERAGVAWSVYRGISDRPDENLVDQAVFALSKPDGSADVVALAKFVARDPRRAKMLAHLNRCMETAANAAAVAAFDDLRRS